MKNYIIILLAGALAFGCTSKHVTKSVAKSDSTAVHKEAAVISKAKNKSTTTVKTDKTNKKEVVKEKTVIEFDTMPSVGVNGTAEDFTNGINEDAWSLRQKRIKRITHTKTTIKQVANDLKDSSKTEHTETQSAVINKSDSTKVIAEKKESDKKVFRFNWLWLLLVIPAVYFIYKYGVK